MDGAIAGPTRAAMPPAVWHAAFDDPHAMALAQREAAIEYLSIGDRAYRSDVTLLDFGPFAVQAARDGAHITRGVTHPRRTTLIFGNGPFEAKVNGWDGDQAGAILFGSGTEMRCTVPHPLEWVGYTLDDSLVAAVTDGEAIAPGGSFSVMGDLITRAPMLRGLAVELADLARRGDGALASAGMVPSVLDTLHRALSQGLGPNEGSTRALRQRMRVIAEADAYLDQHQGRTVYTLDLVEALGVPARSLHTAFTSVYGMGPHQYLQLRRLNLVHRALRDARGDVRLVKTVALDHGFWHLGRFAQQYKRLFGEAPSETLGRSQTAPWIGYRGMAAAD